MNNLELFTKKTMTVKQIADILKKDESTIRKIGKSLFPDIFKNGIRTHLNEKQVTAIKLELGNNSELPKTELEKELIIQQALMFQTEKIKSLQVLLEEQKPAVDFYKAVTDSKGAIPMGQVAKVLDMGIGRNKLFEILRGEHILRQNNEPYQTFIDRGYFRVIEQKYTPSPGETRISIKTLVYQKGLDYIRKVLSK